MKSKKLMAALSALTLGATMMGGMAMTANAATVYNADGTVYVTAAYSNTAKTIPTAGGGFQAKVNGNWVNAPHGMFDYNIADIDNAAVYFTDSTNTSVYMQLQVADLLIGNTTYTGYISSIVDQNGTPDNTSDDIEMIQNIPTIEETAEAGDYAGYCVLDVDKEYYMTVTIVSPAYIHMPYTVRFHIL